MEYTKKNLNLIQKGIGILEKLAQGISTRDKMAQYIGCKENDLLLTLNILLKNGLIRGRKDNLGPKERYITQVKDELKINEKVNSCFAPLKGEFYNIAKDTAKIIHEKSYEKRNILEVILYGSALKEDFPGDIDLLIIHNNWGLAPFSRYHPLNLEGKFLEDKPKGEKNDATSIFLDLNGFDYDEKEWVITAIENRIKQSNFTYLPEINEIFDVSIIQEDLLKQYEDNKYLRMCAIDACRDSTFWSTILSEGKIYDKSTHDFSLRVEDKYPGAAELFKPK
jgi:predicted nucleotidyltransferase